MQKHGKRYRESLQKVDRTRDYPVAEALTLAKETSFVNFDATVEMHLRLGVDPRHADQQVRGVVNLPSGTGKQVRILVFAEGEAVRLAEQAGADYVGSDDLVQKIQEGWLEFDVALAIPQVMGKVGRLGRVLGPRGLMPNPRAGTVVQPEDLPRLIREARQGRVEYRVDRTANLHIPIGKVSFSLEQLMTNFVAVLDSVRASRPSGARGRYVRKIVVSTSMGPGIKVDLTEAEGLRAA